MARAAVARVRKEALRLNSRIMKWVIVVVVASILIWLLHAGGVGTPFKGFGEQSQKIKLSDFMNLIQNGDIASGSFNNHQEEFDGVRLNGQHFTVDLPGDVPDFDQELFNSMQAKHITFDVKLPMFS